MPNRLEYKEALSKVDRDIRLCLLYLEGLIEEKFSTALKVKQPPTPKVDFSKIESTMDSLQKQIEGLRLKVDEAYSFVQEHDDQEQYLKKMTKDIEEIADGIKEHFEELYKSGYYREGIKRKLRAEGLINE